ncbi:MAG: DUF169 domain-containing protein [Chloroflexi bacterium]|nr:DUF169 domain-containing protein [Chloroflexota bacterium]
MSEDLSQDAVDLSYLNSILLDKMRLKRQPVAISFCQDGPPEGYESVRVPACAIVHLAEQGRRIYVDRGNHDCWVGQYHLGFLPDPDSFISDGAYLTMAQGFFTEEGARRNKQQSYSLPGDSIQALAAAPLPDVPAGTPVDLLICICNAQQAMQIAGAASVRSGEFPHGELGPSACSSMFAAPWHLDNSVFTPGDGGGRGFNKVASGELFVAIPRRHFRYIIELIENFRIDPHKMREVIMPSHAPDYEN